jgi:hypothetical protein
LQNILDGAAVVPVLHAPRRQDTLASARVLLTIDEIADEFSLHDDVLDGILVDLGFE